MSKIKLYHGSDHIIKKPNYMLGKIHNDYGRGFYCTQDIEMGKEWACKENKDGFVNEYLFDTANLNILNLFDSKYTVLNWIGLLLENRIFNLDDEISIDAKDYIIKNFSIDLTNYDVVCGYRADDSYFSYAQSFVSNNLPLKKLALALQLGKLGKQEVLISKKAFNQIEFINAEPVDKQIYYKKFITRDIEARTKYQSQIKRKKNYKEDIFIMDILREEIKNDDPRILQIVCK